MDLAQLKKLVCAANIRLQKEGLVALTWGNVSGIDRESGLVAIKPSGVPYEELTEDQIVVLELQTGKKVQSDLNPSSDTPTHLELYRAFPEISAVVHTHSPGATAWAQACAEIPVLGTTHADCFCGNIPCTRDMWEEEVKEDYELNTGKVIIERFKGLNPMDYPAVLVAHHGPFCWGKSPDKAVETAVVLEEVAKMAIQTRLIKPVVPTCPQYLVNKHFYRKHGANAYYGQSK